MSGSVSETSRSNPTSEVSSRGERTRAHIKKTALRLFSQKGLDGVSAREIMREAGQKNVGSINYYFSSLQDLTAELVRDVAQILDKEHNRQIDLLEAAGGPKSMREVALILLENPLLTGSNTEIDEYSFRFIIMLLINHRNLMVEAISGYDSGSRRCLAHMRRMAPDMPPELLQQRLMIVMIFIVATASARESARDNERAWNSLWGTPAVEETLADSIVGIICQPPSDETLAARNTTNLTD